MDNDTDSNIDSFSEESGDKIDTNKPIVYVILEQANLEILSSKGQNQIINSDDHYNYIYKKGKKLEDYRPDITYQVLT